MKCIYKQMVYGDKGSLLLLFIEAMKRLASPKSVPALVPVDVVRAVLRGLSRGPRPVSDRKVEPPPPPATFLFSISVNLRRCLGSPDRYLGLRLAA